MARAKKQKREQNSILPEGADLEALSVQSLEYLAQVLGSQRMTEVLLMLSAVIAKKSDDLVISFSGTEGYFSISGSSDALDRE